ncbi:uncharacterized protein LOC107027486 [Solanum pennellii]|uniref:Uncharacterized protein LOC107027486 n=1 Tax=Solanum pennellii TaxID=28526 RepID=A0ABM1HE09_SOLPN|nr:uncharacterized protein LOC107027486 [Solanum pennellii]
MNQSTMLKKKGLNPNKAQSPLKNLDVDMQYRSSAELANKFKIKREQLANERNDKAKKEQALISHKRKNFEDFIPQQGKSKLLGHKSVIQSSSREELRTSRMIAGKGQTKQRFHTSFNKDVTASAYATGTTLGNGEARHDILDLPNCKQVKRKPVIPASTLDQFRKDQGIHKDDETKRDNNTTSDVEFMHTPIINEHNKGLDDRVEQEEEINIDCSTKEMSKPKNVRGHTTCKDIHARNLEERKEVTFDKGQAVGPTNKIVSQLSHLIGTIARNRRFISLMYTGMWCQRILKRACGNTSITLEDMLAKCPDGIPHNQFRQLIEYWKHPTVQAICEMNSQNRKKQMGPINFARVRVALRAAKDNNEEPSKPEIFIATRTKTGKGIQADTQVEIVIYNFWKVEEPPSDSPSGFGEYQP